DQAVLVHGDEADADAMVRARVGDKRAGERAATIKHELRGDRALDVRGFAKRVGWHAKQFFVARVALGQTLSQQPPLLQFAVLAFEFLHARRGVPHTRNALEEVLSSARWAGGNASASCGGIVTGLDEIDARNDQ